MAVVVAILRKMLLLKKINFSPLILFFLLVTTSSSSSSQPLAAKNATTDISDIVISVEPTTCKISPTESDTTVTYFSLECPEGVTSAKVYFPAKRPDGKVYLDRNGVGLVTSFTATSSQHSEDLQLCVSVDDPKSCEKFRVDVQLETAGINPTIDKIWVLENKIPQQKFNANSKTYEATVYANVETTFGVMSKREDSVFVGPQNKTMTQGFVSSSDFFSYRSRALPGQAETINVFATDSSRSIIRPYNLVLRTISCGDPALASIVVNHARLEPQFHRNVFSYYARALPGQSSFTVDLEARDDKLTKCIVKHFDTTKDGIFIQGKGSASISIPSNSKSKSIDIECTSADNTASVRYTIVVVPQKGGSTLLSSLDIIGGHLDRPFNPLIHGPYVADLELQRRNDVGWISFVALSANPNAIVTVEELSVNSQGKSPWFRVELGAKRLFRIAVRTKENPVDEEYVVIVNRESRWYESLLGARTLAKWIGGISTVASADSAATAMQNVHFLQFLSMTGRVHQTPETYSAFAAAFNPWNHQGEMPRLSRSRHSTLTNSSHAFVFAMPPEEHQYLVNAREETEETTLANRAKLFPLEVSTAMNFLTKDFLVQDNTKTSWIPALNLKDSANQVALLKSLDGVTGRKKEYVDSDATSTVKTSSDLVFSDLGHEVSHLRRLVALTDQEKLEVIEDVNAEFKKQRAVVDYISSIVLITIALIVISSTYVALITLFVKRGVKANNGQVRNMPVALHPIRFWTFVFDITLMSLAQAALGIITCPSDLWNTEFVIMNFVHTTPKAMLWFSVLVLLLFPVTYLGFVAWALISVKRMVVFSKELTRYHKKDIFTAKAESRIVQWLPIISKLLAIEICDVAPIFAPDDAYVDEDHNSRLPLQLNEETRNGGPCSMNAPEFGTTHNQFIRNPQDLQYSMLSTSQKDVLEPIHYHRDADEMKVSFGGLRTSYAYDSNNTELYNQYPEALVGRKTMQLMNPYGYAQSCRIEVHLKHLSNLLQMSELPHHFHFWIPRRNCQTNELEGWGSLLHLAQRGNYFYYIIDRIVYLALMSAVVVWRESSGTLSSWILGLACLIMCVAYSPAAISSGTSKWFALMEEESRNRRKDIAFENNEEVREKKWPFDTPEMKDKIAEMQSEREKADVCGNGGWFARNPDCGISGQVIWNYRIWLCVREFFTGAAGLELIKFLIVLCMALGNASSGVIANGPASVLAFIVCAVGSFIINYESLMKLKAQFYSFYVEIDRAMLRTGIWLCDTFSDIKSFRGRIKHLLSTTKNQLSGYKTASFDYPSAVGGSVRDFHVTKCTFIADEVGLQFQGPLRPDSCTNLMAKKLGSRHHERFQLEKTLYKSGPLGSRRSELDRSLPVRLPFRNLYLGKKAQNSNLAATIHIVNHGFRSSVTDPILKNAMTEEDDSYLSLYRDAQFIPGWGDVRIPSHGHGYVVQFRKQTRTLMIRGPHILAGREYHLRTDNTISSGHSEDEFAEKDSVAGKELIVDRDRTSRNSVSTGGISDVTFCEVRVECSSSGTLYVPVPRSMPPCLEDSIIVTPPKGESFIIDPEEIKVYYDKVCAELILRHRLFQDSDEAHKEYLVRWSVVLKRYPIDKIAVAEDRGVLYFQLPPTGFPDLTTPMTLTDDRDTTIVIDPKDTDAHRVAFPREPESRGIALVVSRFLGSASAAIRRFRGNQGLRDTVEDCIPCTIVQCVNPVIGHYRVEPNFRDAVRAVRAQIHSVEAQRADLDDVDRLASCWLSVMSSSDFNLFWKKNGVNTSPADSVWINPLIDVHHTLVKNQEKKIASLIPSFRSDVKRLFAARLRDLESDLAERELWVRAYDDVRIYSAQWDRDYAESLTDEPAEMSRHLATLQVLKAPYINKIPGFIYPFEVEERMISRTPNTSAQLRQWQRQLAAWLRTEEDALMASVGNSSPRSVASVSSFRGYETSSLEKTLMEVMHALKDSINRSESLSSGQFRTVLHFVTDSLSVRGPYTNWRPDPIGGHLALVRLWQPDGNGNPDFSKEPVWNPCCLKLSSTAIKILLPGKDDAEYRFRTPYYWAHVLGHAVQLDCLEALEVTKQISLPVGHASNTMLRSMPGQLVCRLTSALKHVGDKNIRLVESGLPGQEILMKQDAEDTDGSVHHSTDGESFLVSLGRRVTRAEATQYPTSEVRLANEHAQIYPLTFRFADRFIDKWRSVLEAAQMASPPIDIDRSFGLESVAPSIATEAESTEPAETVRTMEEVRAPIDLSGQYDGEWRNYRYHGTGKLTDAHGKDVYDGEWRDGKRWGKGKCVVKDSRGREWLYEGEFVSDEIHGNGKLTLIDQPTLKKLQTSKSPSDARMPVAMEGIFTSGLRNNERGMTMPMSSNQPSVHPVLMKKLFQQDPSVRRSANNQIIIDIRRVLSCTPDAELFDVPQDMSDDASVDSRASITDAAREEYLPHRSRWARSMDPSLGFKSVENRLLSGTVKYADGSVYDGPVRNGKPNGKGIFSSVSGATKFEGNFKDGEPHGYGILVDTQSDGSQAAYHGNFVHGKRHGRGVQSTHNGKMYLEGFWTHDNLADSSNVCVDAHPEVVQGKLVPRRFTGSLKNGVPQGDGKLTWSDNIVYRGNFAGGQRDGQGVARDAQNKVLISSAWQDDVPHGRVARCVYPDGRVYTGEMSEGVRQGMGELYHSQKGEPLYEGLWQKDLPHGRGILYAKDGMYEGEFKNGVRSGKGVFDFNEDPSQKGSRKYEGDWSNDVPHGLGFYSNDLGVAKTYKFNNGQLDKSSLKAYKTGMCAKAPLLGTNPVVVPSGLTNSGSPTSFGPQRRLSAAVFKSLCGPITPLWNTVADPQHFTYVPVEKAARKPSRVSLAAPVRPISEDAAVTQSDFQTESPVRQRVLQLMVVEGKDLPVPNGTGKMNAYAKFIIGQHMKKTHVKRGDSSVAWNAALNFPLRREKTIIVEVWEQDLQNTDNFVGQGEADLLQFLDKNIQKSGLMSVPLIAQDEVSGQTLSAGSITFALEIVEKDSALETKRLRSLNSLHSDNSSIAETTNPVVSFVQVKIHQAKDLPNMDVLTKMDPYVIVTMGSKKAQTAVKYNAGSAPVFNEQFSLVYARETRIVFEIFDKDRLKKDDVVGRGELDLLPPQGGFSGYVQLYRADKKKGSIEAGVLEVTVRSVLA